MTRRITTKSASLDIPGSSAATLAECRILLRSIEREITADGGGEESEAVGSSATSSVASAPPLERLEEITRTLLGLLGRPGAHPSNLPSTLLLGVTHSMTGRVLGTDGDAAAALEHYRVACNYFEHVPAMMTATDHDAARCYVEALDKTGQRKEAVDLLVVASSLGELPLSFYLEYARALHEAGETEEGGRLLLATGRQTAGNPDDLFLLGEAAQSEGHFEIAQDAFWDAAELFAEQQAWRDALDACEHALTIPPRRKELVAQQASILLKLGRFAEAAPVARDADGVSVDADVRLDLVRVFLWSGEIERALASIRQAREDTEQWNESRDGMAAACLEAEAYNLDQKWQNALRCAERALMQEPRSPAALVQHAIAASELQQPETAWKDIQEALAGEPDHLLALIVRLDLQLILKRSMEDPAAQLESLLSRALEVGGQLVFVAGVLLRVLGRMGRAAQSLAVLDRLMAVGPASDDLFVARGKILRRLGRQDEAMHELDQVSASRQTKEYVMLKSALLCDTGDFDGALALLRPTTTPIEEAPHLILTLRGWADQNCTEPDSAADGERVYRRALQLKPEDDWSRKGLANALMRLGNKDEAVQQYDRVIEVAQEKRKQRTLDPYDSCLAGWCYYSTNRLKQAAEFYEAGLAAVEIGVAAQFDYALVLLVDASFTPARLQYEKSIRDARTKNLLRQCGLFYVAFFDLRLALTLHPHILGYAETYEFRSRLREVMRETLAKLPPEWDYLGRRMIAAMEADAAEANAQEAESVAPHLLGVRIDSLDRHCGVFSPAFQQAVNDDSFYALPASSAEAVGSLSDATASKVFLVSKEILRVLNLEAPHALAEKMEWAEMDAPALFWAAITTDGEADRLLDKAVELLIARSVDLLTEYFKTGKESEDTRLGSARAARFALAATSKPPLVDRAMLALGAADPAIWTDAGRVIPSALPSSSFLDMKDFKENLRDYQALAELQVRSQVEAAPSSESSMRESKNPFIREILTRAHEIAQIADHDEQTRAAMQAATKMQSFVPLTEELKRIQDKLADDLQNESTFYLENDESVLLMSCEPPFYATSVLVALSGRPGVYSIGFTRAAQRIAQSSLISARTLNPEQPLPSRTLWNRM